MWQPSFRRRQRPRRFVTPGPEVYTSRISVADWVAGRQPNRRRRAPLKSNAELTTWGTGLRALRHLQRCFPDAAATIAAEGLTPARLVHVAEGLLGLANDQLSLHFSYDLPDPALADPLHHLVAPIDLLRSPDSWLAQLDAISWDLQSLTPEGFGVGMSLFFDEADGSEPDMLTVALWRLLDGSAWGTGMEWDWVVDDGPYSTAQTELLMGLAPLPPLRDIDALMQTLTLPRWPYTTPPGTLIAYAVERTDNDLANIQNGPGMGYPITVSWEQLPELWGQIAEANQIARDYGAWAWAVQQDSARRLRQLARQLHAAAEPYFDKRRAANAALIDILVP